MIFFTKEKVEEKTEKIKKLTCLKQENTKAQDF